MPTIDPDLVPVINPGQLFTRFTTDTTLNIRWIEPTDPVFYEVQNRPVADVALRQLILAKALDNINLRLSHQAIFPFLIPPKVNAGTSGILDLPISWIWDMHISIPSKWILLRLTEIQRISGHNPTSTGSNPNDYTGKLRLIFAAQEVGATAETSLFYIDYDIASLLSYQFAQAVVVTSAIASDAVDPSEAETIAGYAIFRTLDLDDPETQTFLDGVHPPADTTDSNGDGYFDTPATYEILDTEPGGASNTSDFIIQSLVHGTGVLVVSAYNSIPPTDSNFNSWLSSNNYPFRLGATRTATNGITIPKAIFREFSIVAPSPDEPSDDPTKTHFPVWVSSIERLDTLAQQVKLIFSTHSVLDETPVAVEFASLVLDRDSAAGTIVNIEPITNLQKEIGSDADSFLQGFGTGHVVLSSLWGASTGEIENFFDAFLTITDVPAIIAFTKISSILSSFSVARNSKFVPTQGQWQALRGSTARRTTPIHPSNDNRFVTELDVGKGEMVDFREVTGVELNVDIEPIAYKGGLAHQVVYLIIDANGQNHTDEDILVRLRCLLGRDPAFGDYWWTGTYLQFYNGNAWVTL